MRKWENEKMRKWENEKMRKLENEKIRKWENLEISKWVVIKSFFNGSDLSDKLDWSGLSEENEKYKKWVGRIFDENRLWDGWG